MAIVSIRSYATSLSSLRGLTKKTLGAWQDPDGNVSQRQHNRFVSPSQVRSQHSELQDYANKKAQWSRGCSEAYGLQYAKFHGHLEHLKTNVERSCPTFEAPELPKWAARLYRTLSWTIKVEPVLRQMASGFDFEYRPTALLLCLGSRAHGLKTSVVTFDSSETARRRSADSGSAAAAVNTNVMASILEELSLELAAFRAELRNAVDNLSVRSHGQISQSCIPSRNAFSIFRMRQYPNYRRYGKDMRPSAWPRSQLYHGQQLRASFHSCSFDNLHTRKSFKATHFNTLLFGQPLDVRLRHTMNSTTVSIRSLARFDGFTAEELWSYCKQCDQEEDAESRNSCETDETLQEDHSLSPYHQAFGHIRLRDVLRPALKSLCSPSLSQVTQSDDSISEDIGRSDCLTSTKTFSNNSISGSARVYLGDLHYDHVTINQYYVLQDLNGLDIDRSLLLEKLAMSCHHIT